MEDRRIGQGMNAAGKKVEMRGWSHPTSQTSPWEGCQMWVLGLTQERTQESAIVR